MTDTMNAATIETDVEVAVDTIVVSIYYDTTTATWRIREEQNPLQIPEGFTGNIAWTIEQSTDGPGAKFPAKAPVLFDNGQGIPYEPPLHPQSETRCWMMWNNARPDLNSRTFTYYVFVQVGDQVFRVDPTVQNQPPG